MTVICQTESKTLDTGNADIGFRLSPIDCADTDLTSEVGGLCCTINEDSYVKHR